MNLHGKEYTEVKDRIKTFLTDFPTGSIRTEVQWNNEDFSKVCVKAYVFPDIIARTEFFTTGLAYEERVSKANDVNETSWVENCETSAIGRALANMNIGVTTNRPSAEEMKKVEKMGGAVGSNGIGEEIIGFGKHKGTKWVDLPTEYLDWLVKNKDTADAVRQKAEAALKFSDLPWEK